MNTARKKPAKGVTITIEERNDGKWIRVFNRFARRPEEN